MDIGGDLRYALRVLRRTPALTLPAVASLAVGIAVNTTMFAVANALLLRPLGGPGRGELVRIGVSAPDQQQFRSASYDELVYLRAHASSLASLAGEQLEALTRNGADGAHAISTEIVAGDYFSTLGVPPIVGRGFIADEGVPGDGAVAVISHRFWRGHFNADPAVAGRALSINMVPLTIVGVAPEGFTGTFPGVDVDGTKKGIRRPEL